MQRKSYYALDIAKFISAFLVICIHTGPLEDISKDANFVLVQIIARIAVPLFFIISGFLFFSKIEMDREWNDYENKRRLKHYVGRLLKIYVIWSILYLPFNYILMSNAGGISATSLLGYVRDFFFTGSYYHLWFLPALMFSVFVVYILLSKFSMRTTLVISVILYALGMAGNIYPQLIENIPYVSKVFDAYIKTFATTRNGLFFGVLFIALGAYFAKQRMLVARHSSLSFVAFLGSLVLLFVEAYVLKENGFMHDLVSMYAMLIPTVCFLFMTLLNLNMKERGIYKVIRVLSLLIYTSHIMFVFVLFRVFPDMNALYIYGMAAGGSLLFSTILYVISRKVTWLQILY